MDDQRGSCLAEIATIGRPAWTRVVTECSRGDLWLNRSLTSLTLSNRRRANVTITVFYENMFIAEKAFRPRYVSDKKPGFPCSSAAINARTKLRFDVPAGLAATR
jgi:hypothetical protein